MSRMPSHANSSSCWSCSSPGVLEKLCHSFHQVTSVFARSQCIDSKVLAMCISGLLLVQCWCPLVSSSGLKEKHITGWELPRRVAYNVFQNVLLMQKIKNIYAWNCSFGPILMNAFMGMSTWDIFLSKTRNAHSRPQVCDHRHGNQVWARQGQRKEA